MREAATRIPNNALTGIRRTDNDRNGTHGWVVHVQRRSRVFIKCFSDGVYGGKTQAYRAAIKHRDGIITNHPPFTRGEYADILRTNNTSGVRAKRWIEVLDRLLAHRPGQDQACEVLG